MSRSFSCDAQYTRPSPRLQYPATVRDARNKKLNRVYVQICGGKGVGGSCLICQWIRATARENGDRWNSITRSSWGNTATVTRGKLGATYSPTLGTILYTMTSFTPFLGFAPAQGFTGLSSPRLYVPPRGHVRDPRASLI